MSTFTKPANAKKPQGTERSGGATENQAEHFPDQYPIIDSTGQMIEQFHYGRLL